MKLLKTNLLIVLCLISTITNATIFTVTTTADNGAGSLREAITYANAMPGNHSIVFNIPASDVNYISSQGIWKITPLSTLPFITQNNIIIDGTSQTTFGGNTNINGPEICIDGKHLYGSDFAFHIYNASNIVVKGLIIGGFTVGIEISGSNATNNQIVGNYIGCNYNATDTMSNTHGIELLSGPNHNIIGGITAADRNIFSGNTHCGIRLVNSNNNSIIGNYVGLNRAGNGALKNFDGISIEGTSSSNVIGGYTVGARNFVSGNEAYGVPVFGGGCTNNLIIGNFIGTDITGNIAIPNTYGVLFDDGANSNTVGGYIAGAKNLISGNSGYGIFLYNPQTQNDSVIGNIIGLNFSCTSKLPNANGIVIDGPSYHHFIDSNVISGSLQNGIDIHIGGTDSNVIIRNFIGTDFSGIANYGNSYDGIRIAEGPKYNQIGLEGKGNTIAFNGGNGISVMTDSCKYNKFTENKIYGNLGIGIDLYPLGITPNDAGDCDFGPNNLMNSPTIVTSTYNSNTQLTTIQGTIDHTCDGGNLGITIELFASSNSTGSQAQKFIGRTNTNNLGEWTISTSTLLPSEYITATATDNMGNTSELSNHLVVGVEQIDRETKSENNVFPNPCDGNFSINLAKFDLSSNSTIKLFSPLGQLVYVEIIKKQESLLHIKTNLVDGLYFYTITNNSKVVSGKLIIKK
ncbi:MAG: T9SS type A sorting domain-containing protein [Bacteroidota bacterium]